MFPDAIYTRYKTKLSASINKIFLRIPSVIVLPLGLLALIELVQVDLVLNRVPGGLLSQRVSALVHAFQTGSTNCGCLRCRCEISPRQLLLSN